MREVSNLKTDISTPGWTESLDITCGSCFRSISFSLFLSLSLSFTLCICIYIYRFLSLSYSLSFSLSRSRTISLTNRQIKPTLNSTFSFYLIYIYICIYISSSIFSDKFGKSSKFAHSILVARQSSSSCVRISINHVNGEELYVFDIDNIVSDSSSTLPGLSFLKPFYVNFFIL